MKKQPKTRQPVQALNLPPLCNLISHTFGFKTGRETGAEKSRELHTVEPCWSACSTPSSPTPSDSTTWPTACACIPVRFQPFVGHRTEPQRPSSATGASADLAHSFSGRRSDHLKNLSPRFCRRAWAKVWLTASSVPFMWWIPRPSSSLQLSGLGQHRVQGGGPKCHLRLDCTVSSRASSSIDTARDTMPTRPAKSVRAFAMAKSSWLTRLM